jgi:hypothetical protein
MAYHGLVAEDGVCSELNLAYCNEFPTWLHQCPWTKKCTVLARLIPSTKHTPSDSHG